MKREHVSVGRIEHRSDGALALRCDAMRCDAMPSLDQATHRGMMSRHTHTHTHARARAHTQNRYRVASKKGQESERLDDRGLAYTFGPNPLALILTGGFGFCRADVAIAATAAASAAKHRVRAVGAGAANGELRSFLWQGGEGKEGKEGRARARSQRPGLCASAKAALGRDLGMLMCVKRVGWLSSCGKSRGSR